MTAIDSLLAEMTLQEKLGQLGLATAGQVVTGPQGSGDVAAAVGAGLVGGVFNLWGRDAIEALQRRAALETRLKIPLLFGLDVLHGHQSVFPIPLAEAGAFDEDLWERTARLAASEAARDGINLTFAPMLDVARDPRWGRIAESPGEDPLVASRFARAKVRGFQGADLSAPGALAATAKHFCAYGAATAGRDYAAADVSDLALREVYLPPFRAAVEAGCAALMPAFNSVDGRPMTAHVPLLRDYLRRRLGFDGVIVSDYTAIPELVFHGVAGDLAEAAALALKAGVDMDMASGVYLNHLPQALARGLVEIADIDAAVRRVLRLKQRLGLFEDPFRRGATVDPPGARKALALEAARRSIALLVNRGLLPLRPGLRRIAVVGPLAQARADMLGPWAGAGRAENCVTLVEGLRAALPGCEIACHAGVGVEGADRSGIEAARAAAERAELVVLCLGESAAMSGEAACRARLGLPGAQSVLADAILACATPAVAVVFSGRPLAIGDVAERAGAVLAAWFPGDMAGRALAEILTGRCNPSARLAATWPREVGQVPIFFAERSTGRPENAADAFTSKYLDIPNEPLFPFGHGLSYAEVCLENLRTGARDFTPREALVVEVDAVNEGAVATQETIFLFIRDLVASVARPLLELKDWAKVVLAPGEKRTIAFALTAEMLAFAGADGEPVVEAGEFEIFVGRSADRRGLLTTRVRLRAISDRTQLSGR